VGEVLARRRINWEEDLVRKPKVLALALVVKHLQAGGLVKQVQVQVPSARNLLVEVLAHQLKPPQLQGLEVGLNLGPNLKLLQLEDLDNLRLVDLAKNPRLEALVAHPKQLPPVVSVQQEVSVSQLQPEQVALEDSEVRHKHQQQVDLDRREQVGSVRTKAQVLERTLKHPLRKPGSEVLEALVPLQKLVLEQEQQQEDLVQQLEGLVLPNHLRREQQMSLHLVNLVQLRQEVALVLAGRQEVALELAERSRAVSVRPLELQGLALKRVGLGLQEPQQLVDLVLRLVGLGPQEPQQLGDLVGDSGLGQQELVEVGVDLVWVVEVLGQQISKMLRLLNLYQSR
jgi:hypothetical protein